MQTQEARGHGWLFWPAALEGLCAAIIVSLFLHPALALALIGLGILGALASAAKVRHLRGVAPSKTRDPAGEVTGSA